MNVLNRVFKTTAALDEEQATQLQVGARHHTTTVKPPHNASMPATLERFVNGITEYRTEWLGFKNASPTIAYELRRPTPDTVKLQFSTPSNRMDRKVRAHLSDEIGGLQFTDGDNGLPVSASDTIGGALIIPTADDRLPLRTEFDRSPINGLTSTLHRHAMQDAGIIIQILFKPLAGQPIRNWLWYRRAHQQHDHLRKEKEKIWGSRQPRTTERGRADAIDEKILDNHFHTAIRLLVIGAGDYTQSRVKEIASGFNIYRNPATGQDLRTVPVRSIREQRIVQFARMVALRRFGGWSRRFKLSFEELAGLVALPDRDQQNLVTAAP